MESEEGVSLPTSHQLSPPPPCVDLERLIQDCDSRWLSWVYPKSPQSYLKAATHIRWFTPIDAASDPSVINLWLTPRLPEDAFTNEMLGSIADHWAEVLENYRPDSSFTSQNLAKATRSGDTSLGTDIRAPPWKYPTLSMSMEMKKLLPLVGVRWLFLRAHVKMIERGRMNAEVAILNETLEIVAISHQVNFIVPGLGFNKKINKL